MQVLCIGEVKHPNPKLVAMGIYPKIKIGETYTVKGFATNSYELTFEPGHWYHKMFFIVLPLITLNTNKHATEQHEQSVDTGAATVFGTGGGEGL